MTCRYYKSSGKESISLDGRAVSYALRIGDRVENIFFFRNVLGMRVLRHEEFVPQCIKGCRKNPTAHRWSNTTVGFGPESTNFVFDLHYIYGVKSIALGNNLVSITIRSSEVLEHVRLTNYPYSKEGKFYVLISPDGYKFLILNAWSGCGCGSPLGCIEEIALRFRDSYLTICFWKRLMGMELLTSSEDILLLGYPGSPFKLRFVRIDEPVHPGETCGRLSFALPLQEIHRLDSHVRSYAKKVMVPFININVAGKADVRFMRFRDANLHEVNFFEDVGYRKLDRDDPDSAKLLEKCMEADPFQDPKAYTFGVKLMTDYWSDTKCRDQ